MEKIKVFHAWPGEQKFFWNGRIMLGELLHSPDYERAIISFALILIPILIFLYSSGPYFINSSPEILIIEIIVTLLSLTFLVISSITNPGFIPKQDHPFAKGPVGAPTIMKALRDEPSKSCALDKGHFELPFKERKMRFKFCNSCLIMRPPRCSHCGDCDVCIEKFDHHCPWLGNCIGKYNYKYFISFLYFTSLLIILSLGFAIDHLANVMYDIEEDGHSGGDAFVKMLEETGGTLFVIIYIAVMMWFVLGLTSFHTFLIFTNKTTHEILKKTWKYPNSNPYFRKIAFNICEIFKKKPKQLKVDFQQFSEGSANHYNISISKNALKHTNRINPTADFHKPAYSPKKIEEEDFSNFQCLEEQEEIQIVPNYN